MRLTEGISDFSNFVGKSSEVNPLSPAYNSRRKTLNLTSDVDQLVQRKLKYSVSLLATALSPVNGSPLHLVLIDRAHRLQARFKDGNLHHSAARYAFALRHLFASR